MVQYRQKLLNRVSKLDNITHQNNSLTIDLSDEEEQEKGHGLPTRRQLDG